VFTSFHSPLKEKSKTPAKHRHKMARIAFEKINSKITTDPYEIKQDKKTYTYQLLDFLKSKYPAARFTLILGTDCINEFAKWKKYKYILKNANIIAAKRKNYRIDKNLDFKFTLLPCSFDETASAHIRHNILVSGKIPRQIPEKVSKYIIKNNFYGLDIHKWLKKNISPGRYNHTLHAAALAYKLAQIHGTDTLTAVKTALLHDCAKGINAARLMEYAIENKIKVPNLRLIVKNQPSILHSFVSANIAAKIFKVKDHEILNAIITHTLGSFDMSKLAKIIYIADAASTDRTFKAASVIRKTAFKDLDKAITMALKTKIAFVIENYRWLYPDTIHLWNRIITKRKQIL
jgi:nicotinate-nucleotide adenylyltransferase